MRVAIIGGGLAGLTCGTRLQAAGHTVRVFDKGRGPGGRMATRRTATPAGEASFDHGAQYFTVRNDGFRRQVDAWAALGSVALWPAAGSDAWVGLPAMSSPVKALAHGLDVRWNTTVAGLVQQADGWALQGEGIDDARFEVAIIAVPAEQAAPLLTPWAPDFAQRAAVAVSEPCWTLMVAFSAAVPIARDTLRSAGSIGWAARNSAKPGRAGPEAWVIQASPDWSRQNLEFGKEATVPMLMDAFATAISADLPPPVAAVAHRWRYAKSAASGEGALWDAALRLGVCGDWLLGARVECAWMSGDRLACAIGDSGYV